MNQVIAYKVNTLANLKPNAIVALKTAGENTFSLYVTDLQGAPHSLKLPATTGVQQIINTDGALQVVGSTNVVINLEPAILASINSALQVGDNISSLLNDAGYLTSFTETDPIFLASEASNFVVGDKANLDNQSGINAGDETTSTIQIKRPLKTITNKSLEGTGNIGIDYNELDNKPTIPSPITNHSGLSLDDGTNPHGTTKGDVGLSNVDNTSDIDKPISNATQTALNSKQNSLGFTPENVSNKENTTLDASPTKYPTNRLLKEVIDLKLDKVTTSGVERAYIINADGSQGTKITSDFNISADNGLNTSNDPKVVELGGRLTKNTVINTNGLGLYLKGGQGQGFIATSYQPEYSPGGSASVEIGIQGDSAYLKRGLQFFSNKIILKNDTIEQDYDRSFDYTDRSLVDKQYTDSVKQTTITTSRTALPSDNGKLIKIKGNATYKIDQSTLPTGWNVIVRTFAGATGTFLASWGTTFDAPTGLVLNPLKMCSIIKDSDDDKILINGETSLT